MRILSVLIVVAVLAVATGMSTTAVAAERCTDHTASGCASSHDGGQHAGAGDGVAGDGVAGDGHCDACDPCDGHDGCAMLTCQPWTGEAIEPLRLQPLSPVAEKGRCAREAPTAPDVDVPVGPPRS